MVLSETGSKTTDTFACGHYEEIHKNRCYSLYQENDKSIDRKKKESAW
jgi:hypothetical protein